MTKLPTLSEILDETQLSLQQNKLTVLLNNAPPQTWLKEHPMSKTVYLPIDKVQYLLTKIYGKWWVEVLNTQVFANSVSVTVRLFVRNPLTGETEHNDGVGAAPIQTDKGKGAMDWNFAKANGVQIAIPAAKAYAIKDAAEEFGKIFGRDLNRKDSFADYMSILKPDLDTLTSLLAANRAKLTPDEIENAERIIKNNEVNSFSKLFKILSK
jgi:hypothetical protein